MPGGDPDPDLLPAVAGEDDGQPQGLQHGRAAARDRGLLQTEEAPALSHLQLKRKRNKNPVFIAGAYFTDSVGPGARR